MQHGAAMEHVLDHESVDHERDNVPGNRRDAGQWRNVMIDAGPAKAYKPLSRFIHDLDPSEAGCDACRGVGTRIVDYDDFRVAARGFDRRGAQAPELSYLEPPVVR